MTHHMTDERLAELRNMLDRSLGFRGSINGLRIDDRGATISLGEADFGDFRSLLARLAAAEDLLREVANSGVEFDDHRLNWIAAQIGRDTFTKCRSYLR